MSQRGALISKTSGEQWPNTLNFEKMIKDRWHQTSGDRS